MLLLLLFFCFPSFSSFLWVSLFLLAFGLTDVWFSRTLFTPFVVRKALKLGPWRANREMFQFHSKPMSGIVSLFFAIQVCDSVDMYGFDPFTLETRGKYHYFDDRAGMVNVHSFDMAMEIFRRISKAYPMRIHSRGSETKSFTP